MTNLLRRSIGPVVLLAALAVPARASAQSSSAAEALFREAKEQMAAKNYAAACPKFAESYRIDPGTGTLLALAFCQEGAGHFASAWATYLDGARRAKQEGNADREAGAKERAAALEKTLSKLTITVPPAVANLPGLVVKRDGEVVGAAAFGSSAPVDGGTHVIDATAPGRAAFHKSIDVGAMNDTQAVTIADLPATASAAPPAATTTPPVTASPPPPEPPPSGMSTLRIAGIATGGVGVVGLVIGSVFGLSAKSKNDSSKAGCPDDFCDPKSKQERLDAKSAANVSTGMFIAGGVLVAGGVTMFVLGGSKTGEGVAVGPGVGGMWMKGSF